MGNCHMKALRQFYMECEIHPHSCLVFFVESFRTLVMLHMDGRFKSRIWADSGRLTELCVYTFRTITVVCHAFWIFFLVRKDMMLLICQCCFLHLKMKWVDWFQLCYLLFWKAVVCLRTKEVSENLWMPVWGTSLFLPVPQSYIQKASLVLSVVCSYSRNLLQVISEGKTIIYKMGLTSCKEDQ